ncbi:MAG: ABC transporter permease, partial [Eubacteriaceae bacterium]
GCLFYISDASLPILKSNVLNFNTFFNVQAEIKDIDNIEEKFFEVVSKSSNLQIYTIKENINYLQQNLDSQKMPLYSLIGFIAIFGFINFINTLMTNLITRQQEFGMLQSVGLSNKQLYKMLRMESLFYIIGTFIITMTIGTGCGFLLVKVFNQFKVFGELTYHFPTVPIIVYFLVLLLIQGIFSRVAIYFNQKLPLIERIKIAE